MGTVTIVFRKCVLCYSDGAGTRQVRGARVCYDLFVGEHQFSNLYADVDLASATDLDLWHAPVAAKHNYGGFFASEEFAAAVRRYCWSFVARIPRGGWLPRHRMTSRTVMEQFETWGDPLPPAQAAA